MSDKKKNIVAAFLILAGIISVIFGVYHGEISVVLRKAVNICMECIGLG